MRRFQINPGPLRTRGEVPKPDWDAGRCIATLGGDPDAPRCSFAARWSVLTTAGEMELCGVHVRRWRNDPRTLAIEPLDAAEEGAA